MGAMKQYLLKVLSLCCEHNFGQEAVQHAIFTGRIRLTYNLDQDLRLIMGEPGHPEDSLYPELVEEYQAYRAGRTSDGIGRCQPNAIRTKRKDG